MWKPAFLGLAALTVTGCAFTPKLFEDRRAQMSNVDVCRATIDASRTTDYAFQAATTAEARARGLSASQCTDLVTADNRAKATAIVAILGVAALAAASRGGGGGPGYVAVPTDYDWDWDLFYNAQRQLVWACRGVQTGQFADLWRCQSKSKADRRWPSLEAR